LNARASEGFLDWVRAHHPADVRQLGVLLPDLAEDLKRARKRAWSQPKRALEIHRGIAAELTGAAPHLLPVFYEHAARAFLSTGHESFAAQLLGSARQAEAEHGLAVDDAHVDEVFVEFAVAGVLPAKAVAEYSKELSGRLTPERAYRRFARVCVRRTEAGLPPSTQMASALRRLARAAGDASTREQEYLAEMIALPVVIRAPAGWWTAHRPALVKLARRDPVVRGALVNMIPRWHQRDVTFDQARAVQAVWPQILEESGATAALVDPAGVSDVERPSDGSAGWLARVLDAWRPGADDRRMLGLPDLVVRMADTLRAELAASGETVALTTALAADVDLIDLMLSLDIPVTDTGRYPHRLELNTWAASPDRRDLRAIAEEPRLTEAFRKGLRDGHDATGRRHVLRTLEATPGGRKLVTEWVRDTARDAAPAGLPNLPAAQEILASLPPDILALAAKEVAAACAVDLTPELVRTLRGGLFGELCLPEFEEAVRSATYRRTLDDAWPNLIVADQSEARVIGAEGLVLRHRLRRRPEGRGHTGFHYVDGALLVFWHAAEGGLAGYWHVPGEPEPAPDEIGPLLSLTGEKDEYTRRSGPLSVPIPGGGRFTGLGILRAGGTDVPHEAPTSGDGTSLWAWDKEAKAWFRHDPGTGARGERALPPFLSGADDRGRHAESEGHGWVRPAGTDEATPLAVPVDGLLGWRVSELPGGLLRGEDLAGRTVTVSRRVLRGGFHIHPFAALTLPGDDRPRALVRSDNETEHAELVDPDGVTTASTDASFTRGNPMLPPIAFWHLMRPRDPEGSAALRTVDRATAATLLAAAGSTDGDDRRLPTLVRKLLPAITDDVLAEGVAGVVRFVAERHAVLADVAERLARHVEVPPADPMGDPGTDPGDNLLADALSGLGMCNDPRSFHIWGQGAPHAFAQLRQLAHVLRETRESTRSGSDHPRTIETIEAPWHIGQDKVAHSRISVPDLLLRLPALLLRTAAPTTGSAEREALLRLTESIAATGLATEPAGTWRRVKLHIDGATLKAAGIAEDDIRSRGLLPLGGGAFLYVARAKVPYFTTDRDGCDYHALHRDPSGGFDLPSAYRVDVSYDVDFSVIARFRDFVAAVREHGAFAWDEAAANAFGAGTGHGPAASRLLVAGLPDGQSEDFPSAELRDLLGLKAVHATTAGRELARMASSELRAELVASLLPEDPTRLWSDGVDTASAVTLWNERVGAIAPVPDDLVAEAATAMPRMCWTKDGFGGAPEAVRAVLDPARDPDLRGDRPWEIDRWGTVPTDPHVGVFNFRVGKATLGAAGWLAHRLPAGHELRASLPLSLDLLRQRLTAPGMMIRLERNIHFGAFRRAAGAPTEVGESWERFGAVVIPSRLDWDTLPNIVASPIVRTDLLDDHGWDPYLRLLHETTPEIVEPLPDATALRRAYDAAFAASLADPGDPPTGARDRDGTWWPQDPSRSVPDLVAEVTSTHGLSPDAGALYLMLLAMPDPTDRNVTRWTGWKPARSTATRKELAARHDIVLEARRARAGRSLFLPGGWIAHKAPSLPLEAWKLPFFDPMKYDGPILDSLVPLEPAAALYRRTWQRVLDGDGPRFEELPTS